MAAIFQVTVTDLKRADGTDCCTTSDFPIEVDGETVTKEDVAKATGRNPDHFSLGETILLSRKFASVEEFQQWFNNSIEGEECVDNWRECWADDIEDMAIYEEIYKSGCCGFSDRVASINGRDYCIGCNFGH